MPVKKKSKVTQIVYNDKARVLKKGKLKNYSYVIVYNGRNPCAYVGLSLTDKVLQGYNINYNINKIRCHGGITYASKVTDDNIMQNYYHISENVADYWIGIDYAHTPMDYVATLHEYGKKYTVEEIYAEVKNIIAQLVQMNKT